LAKKEKLQGKASKRAVVSLRMPGDMLRRIDSILKVYPYKVPRHMWIVEAVSERLLRSERARSAKSP